MHVPSILAVVGLSAVLAAPFAPDAPGHRDAPDAAATPAPPSGAVVQADRRRQPPGNRRLPPGSRTGSLSRPGPDLAIRYRGFVLPSKEVELNAPIEEILAVLEVGEGDRVKQGQVLARMDDRLQKVVVEAARVRADSRAEITAAALDVEDAKLTLELTTKAFDDNAATDFEVRRARIQRDQAIASETAARENYDLAQVNLRLEEERLARYRILAPFDGTVIRVITEAGAMLTDMEKILHLAQLDPLEAQIDLPIELHGRLEVGQTYTLVADHPVNTELIAELRLVNPIIDTASSTFRCSFAIDNPGARLPAGFTVHLKWAE